jgi:hypothetical protein
MRGRVLFTKFLGALTSDAFRESFFYESCSWTVTAPLTNKQREFALNFDSTAFAKQLIKDGKFANADVYQFPGGCAAIAFPNLTRLMLQPMKIEIEKYWKIRMYECKPLQYNLGTQASFYLRGKPWMLGGDSRSFYPEFTMVNFDRFEVSWLDGKSDVLSDRLTQLLEDDRRLGLGQTPVQPRLVV